MLCVIVSKLIGGVLGKMNAALLFPVV